MTTFQRANLDAAAANLRLEIIRRIEEPKCQAKALKALALVVEISTEVMVNPSSKGRTDRTSSEGRTDLTMQ